MSLIVCIDPGQTTGYVELVYDHHKYGPAPFVDAADEFEKDWEKL